MDCIVFIYCDGIKGRNTDGWVDGWDMVRIERMRVVLMYGWMDRGMDGCMDG